MTQSLRLLLKTLGGLFLKKAPGDEIDSTELVTRYIFDKKFFRRSNNSVRFGAFMPYKGETSVFRIASLANKDIWNIGDKFVAKPRGRSIKSRADITVKAIQSVKDKELKVVSETSTHPLHANIVGWPADESAQQMLAVELANESTLYFPNI